jgi:hypothetical protein
MKSCLNIALVVSALLACAAPAAAAPFALYGISRTYDVNADVTVGTLATQPAPGPWVWGDFKAPPLVGWDERATFAYSWTAGAGNPEGNNVFSQPLSSKAVITAHDDQSKVIGTLELDGQGTLYADLDAAHAIVDPVGGAILYRVGGVGGLPGKIETALITSATGVFANQVSLGQEVQYHISGYSIKDLIPGMPLQDNLFAAPWHGFFSEFALVSVPEPSGLALAALAGIAALAAVRRSRRRSREGDGGGMPLPSLSCQAS